MRSARQTSGLSARRGFVWLLYPTLFLLKAHGQDALFSSVSLDESIAARSSLPPDRPHLGPVQYDLGGYAGVAYDDNINGSQNAPASDVILRTGVNLNLNWSATDHSTLQFATGIGYLDYLKYSGNSGLEVSPNSALIYAISLDEVTLTLFDQFSYSRQVRTEAALANLTILPQLDNNAGVRAEWDPGQLTLLASYGHEIFLSDHANDYLNRSSENFFARVGWRFAEATQAGIEASDALTYYQVAGENNNQNLSVGGYVEWQVRPSLHFTLRGGPAFFEPYSSGATGGSSSFDSYYVSLEATHHLADFLDHSLSIVRNVSPGLNLGSSYIEQLTLNYEISWKLTQRITVTASASYTDGRQPLELPDPLFPIFPILVTEHYQQYGGGLKASWRFTDHLSADFSFNHGLRNSNLPDRGYRDNYLSLQLNYAF